MVADVARGVENTQGEHADRVQALVRERLRAIRVAQRFDETGVGPEAVSLAVCMATQMWQRFLVAIVMTTTSRATGSSVVFSKIAVSLKKPSRSCGDAAIRAIPAGR
jgi:hypothetical protein